MSSPYQSQEKGTSETVDDLMLREDEPEGNSERSRAASSVRDIASRIPESLSAIGRDIGALTRVADSCGCGGKENEIVER